jgi:hypothetical protein
LPPFVALPSLLLGWPSLVAPPPAPLLGLLLPPLAAPEAEASELAVSVVLLPEDVLSAEAPLALALASPELPWPAALPSAPAAALLAALDELLPEAVLPPEGAFALALSELPWLAAPAFGLAAGLLAALDALLLPRAPPRLPAALLPLVAGAAAP